MGYDMLMTCKTKAETENDPKIWDDDNVTYWVFGWVWEDMFKGFRMIGESTDRDSVTVQSHDMLSIAIGIKDMFNTEAGKKLLVLEQIEEEWEMGTPYPGDNGKLISPEAILEAKKALGANIRSTFIVEEIWELASSNDYRCIQLLNMADKLIQWIEKDRTESVYIIQSY